MEDSYLPMLRRHYEVTAVPSEEQAIRALRAFQPTMVVTELTLPDGDGVSLCRESKAFNDAPSVLAITSTPERVPAALKAGCDAILMKPFAPQSPVTRGSGFSCVAGQGAGGARVVGAGQVCLPHRPLPSRRDRDKRRARGRLLPVVRTGRRHQLRCGEPSPDVVRLPPLRTGVDGPPPRVSPAARPGAGYPPHG